MAVNRQAAAQPAELSEREYQDTINNAVKATEQEIFADALGDDELDMDGDTSLEDMGDGLEGEVEADDAEDPDGQGEGDEAEAEDDSGEEAELEAGEAEGDEGAEEQPRDQRGKFQRDQPTIPPAVLRQSNERARIAEERAQRLEQQVAEYNGRLTELSARVNSQPQRQEAKTEAPPKPDMFAEPEKYEAWVIAEADRRAEAKIEQRFTSFQQQQQQRELQRVDQSFQTAARGPRQFEFNAAYNALTSLNPADRNARALVNGILTAPDPAKAMFDWWEENGASEYRENILNQLLPADQRPRPRADGGRQQPQQRSQVRHEIRGPQRLPSLNGASGSNSQRTADPEMMDGSEASIFRYGTRP